MDWVLAIAPLAGVFVASMVLTWWLASREDKASRKRRGGEHWLAGDISAGIPTAEAEARVRPINKRRVPAAPARSRRRRGYKQRSNYTGRYGPRARQGVEYDVYINGPDWRAKRLERRRLDEDTCCRCGGRPMAEGGLHVHHLTYDRLGHELMRDLRTLCAACHGDVHGLAASRDTNTTALPDDQWVAQTERGAMTIWGSRWGERTDPDASGNPHHQASDADDPGLELTLNEADHPT